MIKGLTDDWEKDREYIKNYDFNISEVKEAIPPTDEELEELKKKYMRPPKEIFYGYEIMYLKDKLHSELDLKELDM